MELQEFIFQTITEIIQGIDTAQQHPANFRAVINSGQFTTRIDKDTCKHIHYDNPAPQSIEFDIAITVSDDAQSTKDVKASINVLGSNLQSKDSSSESTIHRIRFTVPVIFPTK